MTSNCYVVYNTLTRRCIVIDPGSEKSEREIDFINVNSLQLDYIIITHEHTDHNWGVNVLRSRYSSANLICSEECSKRLQKSNKMYFLLYYDDPSYSYVIDRPDIIVTNDKQQLEWGLFTLCFFLTPGHSYGSMCIRIDNMLFTGDTIMPYPPYFNGRDSNRDDWEESIPSMLKYCSDEMIIQPGHGEPLNIKEWKQSYFKKMMAQ